MLTETSEKFEDFSYLAHAIRIGYEIEICYNNRLYSIIGDLHGYDKSDSNHYWYFIDDALDYRTAIQTYKGVYRVCRTSESEELIAWLKDFVINGKTIEEIFDQKLFDWTNLPPDL